MPTIEREIRTGDTWQVGDYQITPQNQVLMVRMPGKNGGVIWNRPKAILVRTPDGLERNLPIRDVTRLTIWSMLLGGMLGAVLMSLMWHRK